ncbi:MAG: hypothetical protein QW282_09105 [Nitrososphaerales archaeon]
MVREYTLTLKHYITEDNSNKIIGIGVGSAGCKIASKISSFKTGINRFYYISCDENDLIGLNNGEILYIPPLTSTKREPSLARGAGMRHRDKISRILRDSKVTLIITGLGGAVGSGLAPLIAELAKEQNSLVLGVAVMPSSYEHSKLFYSSVALRHFRSSCDYTIVIDKDDFTQSMSDRPIIEVYEEISERISFALSRVLGAFEKEDYYISLSKFITTSIKDRFTLLTVSNRSNMMDAVSEAVASIYRKANPAETESALLYLCGSKDLLAGEVEDSVRHLSTLLGNGSVKVEYGFSTNGYTKITSIVLASGFKTLKHAKYDVLENIFDAERKIDAAPECAVDLDLSKITQMEHF